MSPTNSSINKQLGFGIIEILLIIIVVGVLGATGWYALHTKHQTDQILSQSEKINQEAAQQLINANSIKTYQACVNAGGKIDSISQPKVVCVINGKTYTSL